MTISGPCPPTRRCCSCAEPARAARHQSITSTWSGDGLMAPPEAAALRNRAESGNARPWAAGTQPGRCSAIELSAQVQIHDLNQPLNPRPPGSLPMLKRYGAAQHPKRHNNYQTSHSSIRTQNNQPQGNQPQSSPPEITREVRLNQDSPPAAFRAAPDPASATAGPHP